MNKKLIIQEIRKSRKFGSQVGAQAIIHITTPNSYPKSYVSLYDELFPSYICYTYVLTSMEHLIAHPVRSITIVLNVMV